MKYLTLAPENEAKILCPIFNYESKVSLCLKLRDLVWTGKRPDQRVGCQACMRAGKCPMANIMQGIALAASKAPAPDEYGSLEPVTIKLRMEHLERILPVMVTPAILADFRPSPSELALIETANERILKAMTHAPKSDPKSVPRFTSSATPKVVPRVKPAEAPVDPSIIKAAASGDLAAAIS